MSFLALLLDRRPGQARSAKGSSTGATAGAILLSEEGSASRTLSASWIADSAASVGSFIFGVFAMSIVASLVTLDQDHGRKAFLAAPRARQLRSPWTSVGGELMPPCNTSFRQRISYRLGGPK